MGVLPPKHEERKGNIAPALHCSCKHVPQLSRL